MRLSHGRQLCDLCLTQHHKFTLQLEPFNLQASELFLSVVYCSYGTFCHTS